MKRMVLFLLALTLIFGACFENTPAFASTATDIAMENSLAQARSLLRLRDAIWTEFMIRYQRYAKAAETDVNAKMRNYAGTADNANMNSSTSQLVSLGFWGGPAGDFTIVATNPKKLVLQTALPQGISNAVWPDPTMTTSTVGGQTYLQMTCEEPLGTFVPDTSSYISLSKMNVMGSEGTLEWSSNTGKISGVSEMTVKTIKPISGQSTVDVGGNLSVTGNLDSTGNMTASAVNVTQLKAAAVETQRLTHSGGSLTITGNANFGAGTMTTGKLNAASVQTNTLKVGSGAGAVTLQFDSAGKMTVNAPQGLDVTGGTMSVAGTLQTSSIAMGGAAAPSGGANVSGTVNFDREPLFWDGSKWIKVSEMSPFSVAQGSTVISSGTALTPVAAASNNALASTASTSTSTRTERIMGIHVIPKKETTTHIKVPSGARYVQVVSDGTTFRRELEAQKKIIVLNDASGVSAWGDEAFIDAKCIVLRSSAKGATSEIDISGECKTNDSIVVLFMQ